MSSKLTKFELDIIDEIIRYNGEEGNSLKLHIPHLRVKSREYTGVGIYVNFDYIGTETDLKFDSTGWNILSSNRLLEMDSIEHGLNYMLHIQNGRFEFLEIVTYVDLWDGSINTYWFR